MPERNLYEGEKSQLEIIREVLSSNDRFTVVREIESCGLYSLIGHSVNFYVAPREPILDPTVLQEELMRLVPLKPTTVDNFTSSELGIGIGKLYFDQTGTRSIKTTQQIVLKFNGDEVTRTYSSSEDEEIIRRVLVRLYPSIEIAERVLDNIRREKAGEQVEDTALEYFIPHQILGSTQTQG